MAWLDYVEDFAREVHRGMTQDAPTALTSWPLYRKGQGYILFEESEAEEYQRVVAKLLHEKGLENTISPKALGAHVDDVLFSALDFGSDGNDDAEFEKRLGPAMVDLRRRLKEPPAEYLCHIRVFGLDDDGLPWTLGGVRLIHMSSVRMRRLALPRGLQLSKDDRSERRRLLGSLKDDDFLGQPMAVVSVHACDEDAAEELARRRIREVIDVLNFHADLVPQNHAWLYLAGEAADQFTTSVISGPNGFLSIPSAREGPLGKMSLGRLRSTQQLQPSLKRVTQLLGEKSRSEVEELLVNSVRWAGRASVEPIPEHAFLQYVVALEALILPTDSRAIKNQLQTRVAHLLANTARDRLWYHDTIKTLYEVRSSIAHDGSSEVDPRDLSRLRVIVKSSIQRILTYRGIRALATLNDLARWLDTR